MSIKETIKALSKELKQLEKEYYSGNSKTDDEIYDFKLRTLLHLENQYPEYASSDSPTKKIGFFLDPQNIKLQHELPMLSLNNAFNEEELNTFFAQCEKEEVDLEYFLEPKIDGASISLIYENGYLSKAISRGDGEIGEDLTQRIIYISSIPIHLRIKERIVVRGEIYINKSSFERLKYDESTNKTFSNHRNFVSGTLRLKDYESISKKELNIKVYSLLHATERHSIYNQSEVIEYIRSLGFNTHNPKDLLKSSNKEEIFKFIKDFCEIKKTSDIPYDGLVIKVNDLNKLENIGHTSKFPKWAIAYKYPSLIKESKLLQIIPTVGRTGKITYSARIEPVELEGSIVQYATLHNANYIQELDLRIGDYVSVYKSGEIVPKIVGFSRERREANLEKWIPINECPSCGNKLITRENLSTQFCINKECLEKKYAQLIHFTSRSAADIEGLSKSMIIKFHKLGIVKKLSDIYKLHQYREQVLGADLRIKEKLFDKLILAINKSKNSENYRLLFGLGIEFIGEEVAYLLFQSFNNIDTLLSSTKEELMKVDGVGEKCAESLVSWAKDESNMALIEELKGFGLFKATTKVIEENFIKDKRVVVTGKLSIPREEFQALLRNKYGAIIAKDVSAKVNYLVVGEGAGSKLKKAKELNIEVFTEEELMKKLCN
ncbi:DNA ligase (NAD(+)) LigA [Candidatus Mycoplasma haematobovis]|uniref:DNA ligase n=1 Tax=Candidatus Mycoplasma haematobovis TaxID=432608 RepID=A0A1A9QDM5_9MOLU|nr:NAD-dependent DNA ligase LigA [Candidatus Mycoplasma haematobovis]OAL10194.1 DNA ligase (NAD(+)) LigA [Candidatus Mycoplasma haematobovis]